MIASIKKKLFIASFAFQILLVAARPSAGQSIPSYLSAQVTETAPLMIRFQADDGSLKRFYLIPGSPERRERFKVFYKDYLSRLEQLPFESMSVGGKVDYLLFKRDL